MNDISKDKLRALNDDSYTIKALSELFYEVLAKEEPEINETINNEVIGQRYRSYHDARNVVDKAFKELSFYKVNNIIKTQFNKGK